MNSNNFVFLFRQEILLPEKKRLLIENYSNSKTWTSYMDIIIISLFAKYHPNTDDRSKSHSSEYAHIDHVFWSTHVNALREESLKNFSFPFKGKIRNQDTWTIDVAIEHENNAYSWIYELKQLMLVEARLRVLIAYTSLNLSSINDYNTALKLEQESIFNLFSDIHSHYPNGFASASSSLEKEFLIILGHRNEDIEYLKLSIESPIDEYLGYRYYRFRFINDKLEMSVFNHTTTEFEYTKGK